MPASVGLIYGPTGGKNPFHQEGGWAMNDSVGKIGIDQLDQATSKGKRRVKQAEQAKAFPGQQNAC